MRKVVIMNQLKLSIEEDLKNGDLEQAKVKMVSYEKEYPADMDVIAMRTAYEIYSNNLDEALKYALEGVRRYPTSADLHYNLGNVYEGRSEWFLAWYHYGKAYIIYAYTNDDKAETLGLANLINHCTQLLAEDLQEKEHADCEELLRNEFGLKESAFRGVTEQVVGKYFWESAFEKRYVGSYRDNIFTRTYEGNSDLMHAMGEFVKVTEGNAFTVPSGDADMLLPIAVENDNTLHKIVHGTEEVQICQIYKGVFNYYRLPADSKVYSSGQSYYGKPIVLHQEPDKKKLVLNLFVDGLSQCILDGEEFRKIMPYTAAFFEKGTVCERAYSTAEWTYPSLATYVTGVDTTRHMMFHNEMDGRIPVEYPTLAEYFQEKGYFTAMLNGNWRIIPTYGHARGYDSFVYQHAYRGMRTEMIAGTIIDHLEAFKESNQFLWVSLNDLHLVADGFDMPVSVQSTLSAENYIEETMGPTSVKQEYSENKQKIYKKMAGRMDLLLNIIYQYIESHYQDDEILITLFSDHGQGYLIPPGEHFCSEGRHRVAFMFRGDKVQKQLCNEVISINDYITIMCHLAGIQMKEIEIDGKLPRAFGGTGREYAIAESLHPEEPYQAAIYGKDRVFYFSNPSPVQHDGRFELVDYQAKLVDLQGYQIDNVQEQEKYLGIILEHIAPLLIV